MPAGASQSVLERRATRRALVGLAAVAVVAVGAFVGATAVARHEGAGTPAHTVSGFLTTAVAEHNGVDACRYLTDRAVREIAAVEPRDTPCSAALDFGRLTLGGRDVDLESTIKGLSYDVWQHGSRARVTIRGAAGARTFLLRKATRQELLEFRAPPTPWRIDAGVAALVRR